MRNILYLLLPCLLVASCSPKEGKDTAKKIASLEVKYWNDSTKNHTSTFLYDQNDRLKELKEVYANGEEVTQKFTYTDSTASYIAELESMTFKGEYELDENNRVTRAIEENIMDTINVKGTNEYEYHNNKLTAIANENTINDSRRAMLVLDAKWEGNDLKALTSGWYQRGFLGNEGMNYKIDIQRDYDTTLMNNTLFDLNYLIERDFQKVTILVYDPLIAGKYGQKTEHMMTKHDQIVTCQEDSTKGFRVCYSMKYEQNPNGDIKTVDVLDNDGEKFMTVKIKYK